MGITVASPRFHRFFLCTVLSLAIIQLLSCQAVFHRDSEQFLAQQPTPELVDTGCEGSDCSSGRLDDSQDDFPASDPDSTISIYEGLASNGVASTNEISEDLMSNGFESEITDNEASPSVDVESTIGINEGSSLKPIGRMNLLADVSSNDQTNLAESAVGRLEEEGATTELVENALPEMPGNAPVNSERNTVNDLATKECVASSPDCVVRTESSGLGRFFGWLMKSFGLSGDKETVVPDAKGEGQVANESNGILNEARNTTEGSQMPVGGPTETYIEGTTVAQNESRLTNETRF